MMLSHHFSLQRSGYDTPDQSSSSILTNAALQNQTFHVNFSHGGYYHNATYTKIEDKQPDSDVGMNKTNELSNHDRPSHKFNRSDMTYTGPSLLDRHTGSRPKKLKYQCPVCGKEYEHKCRMEVHMRDHTGERPYPCSECNEKFKRKQNLKSHMLVHTEEHPYKCTECDEAFKRPSNLKSHMLVHTVELPYTCTECNEKFKRKHDLKSHMLVHTEEYPYKCTECDETFKRPNNLKSHMRVHCGERP